MTRILKGGKKVSSLRIEKFIGSGYEFYGLMGKYFAEPKYKKEMPYLINRDTNIWFIAFKKGPKAFDKMTLVGFGAVNETKNKIVFEHSFVEEKFRGNGVWKEINDARFEYARYASLPMEVITKELYLQKYWEDNGFEVFKTNGRYTYLRKGPNTCIII